MPWPVRLHPLAIDHELGDGALAHVLDNLGRRSWRVLDIDLGIWNPVLLQEALGFATVPAPVCGIDQHVHGVHHSEDAVRCETVRCSPANKC